MTSAASTMNADEPNLAPADEPDATKVRTVAADDPLAVEGAVDLDRVSGDRQRDATLLRGGDICAAMKGSRVTAWSGRRISVTLGVIIAVPLGICRASVCS